MLYYVYILHSPKHDKYYVGQTPDLETRLLFHNELSEKSFTSKYRPWELARSIPVASRGDAIRLERYIKSKKSKRYIRYLVNNEHLADQLSQRFCSAGQSAPDANRD